MQHNDTPDDDFDDLDDDLDLDTGDDNLDESWDDEGDESIQDLEVSEAEESPAPPKEKTFLQKNFTFIASGLVIVFAAIFVLPMLMNKPASLPVPAPQPTDAQPQNVPPVDEIAGLQNDVPPMPAPISGIAEDAGQAPVSSEDNGILTPMPELAADSSNPAPLELEPAPELAEAAKAEEPAALAIPDLPPEPAPTQIAEAEPVLEVLPETIEIAPTVIPDLPPEPPAPVADKAPEINEPAALAIPDLPPEPAPVPAPENNTALNEANSKLENADARIDGLNETLEDMKQELSAMEAEKAQSEEKARKAKEEAEAAQKAAELAEKKASELAAKKAAESAKAAAELAAAKAAEKNAAEQKPSPVKPPKPAEIKEAPKASPAAPLGKSWVLRSARNGYATVAKISTGDVLTIETGETVKGLGKILAVQQENGKWIVRTSQGFISQ